MFTFEKTIFDETVMVGYSSGMKIQMSLSKRGFFFSDETGVGVLLEMKPSGDYPPYPEISSLWKPLDLDGLSEDNKKMRMKWRAEKSAIVWFSDNRIQLMDSYRDHLLPGEEDHRIVSEYILKHISIAFDGRSFLLGSK